MKTPKTVVFVVKRYAVRKHKIRPYAVRKLKMKQYAMGGVALMIGSCGIVHLNTIGGIQEITEGILSLRKCPRNYDCIRGCCRSFAVRKAPVRIKQM